MTIEIIPVEGLPEIRPGDDLAALIVRMVAPRPGDVLVVAQKVVSKAEGRLVDLDTVVPGAQASTLAKALEADPALVQLVLDQSVRIVRSERVLIVETRHGFVCANGGVDRSNVPGDRVACLLPEDCDASAERLRRRLEELIFPPHPTSPTRGEAGIAVIISDSFGRPWRVGLTNVALGVAGLPALLDLRGTDDDAGRTLRTTAIAVADELAAAAELVMGKTRRVPVAIIRGHVWDGLGGNGRDLVRAAELDLFR